MSEKRFIFLNVGMISVFLGQFLCFSQAQDLPPEIVRYADLVLHNAQV